MNIKKEAEFVLEILNQNGYEAYLVGGCIRDQLLNIESHDLDITTSALSEEVKQCFKGFKILDTGIRHGTVTVIIADIPIEITTFRIEKEYVNHRKPKAVIFTESLNEDLKRRDFTINALCFHPKTGLIDLFDGIGDLKRKTIRCIGNPDERFEEDALRILRAARFASCLGFDVADKTKESMLKNRSGLIAVSMERINQEFSKLLQGTNSADILAEFAELFTVFIPELAIVQNCPSRYKRMLHTLKQSPSNLTLRLAILTEAIITTTDQKVEDLGKAILSKMKYSNQITKRVILLVQLNQLPLQSRIDIKKIMARCLDPTVRDELLMMKQASEETFDMDYWQKIIHDIEASKECLRLSDCCVNGYDCLSLGVPKQKINTILNTILSEIIEDKLENEKNACLSRIKELSIG